MKICDVYRTPVDIYDNIKLFNCLLEKVTCQNMWKVYNADSDMQHVECWDLPEKAWNVPNLRMHIFFMSWALLIVTNSNYPLIHYALQESWSTDVKDTNIVLGVW